MSNAITYFTVCDAIRASNGAFEAAVESSTKEWIQSATTEEIKEAFFDYRVDYKDIRKAA